MWAGYMGLGFNRVKKHDALHGLRDFLSSKVILTAILKFHIAISRSGISLSSPVP